MRAQGGQRTWVARSSQRTPEPAETILVIPCRLAVEDKLILKGKGVGKKHTVTPPLPTLHGTLGD